MNRQHTVALVILACLLGPRMQAEQGLPSKIDQYMQALVDLDRFSGAILVAQNGHVLRQGAYKFANVEWQIPNTADTKFRIGSITKQFTAAAVLLLQERGKLRVSDPICRFVANCPAPWQSISIHHLLTHTSGIPDYVDLPDFDRTKAVPAAPDDLLSRFRDKPLQFKPGEKFQYSNSGYVVLGVIIENVSGQRYEEFVRRNIFDPLQMANSGCDSAIEILPRRAAGYARRGHVLQNASYIDPSVAYAAGALYSTVGDLLTWDEAFYTDKLLSNQSRLQMFKPEKDIVGYGWAIGFLFNHKMQHHNGGIDGFVSNLARFPDDHVLIVVLANRDGISVDSITRDLAAIVFGQSYDLPKARKVVSVSPANVSKYVGAYQITADITLTVSYEQNHFYAEVSGGEGGRFELFAESETKFFSETPPVELVFSAEQGGKMTEILLNGEYKGKRLP